MSGLGEIKGQSAPAAADVEDGHAVAEIELRRQMPLLGELRLFEGEIRLLEIGAGILPVVVEKEFVEPAIEIVVMGDVLLGARGGIVLTQAAGEDTGLQQGACPSGPRLAFEIGQDRLEQVVNGAALHDDPPIHIGFAKGERRVGEKAPFGAPVRNAGGDLGPCTITEAMRAAHGVDQGQRS